MKISGINKHSLWLNREKIESKGNTSFSSFMDMSGKEHSKEQLKQMLKKIKFVGDRLKVKATELTILEYKDLIKDYLSFVLKHYYKIKRARSLDYSTLYTRIEIIDHEVELLTQEILADQMDNMNIIAKIDKISGLLLDIYQ